MNSLDLVPYFSEIIISFSVLLGVIYLVLMGNKFYKHMRVSEEMNRALRMKEFHSSYDKDRLSLEGQVADLNLKLMQSIGRFDEINHLLVSGQKSINVLNDSTFNTNDFFDSLSIKPESIEIDRNLVFVLTPFHPNEKSTFSAIVESFEEYDTRVIRGDEQSVKGDILTHIIKMMLSARIIIADVSTRNPNVMYELGIAHALGKDVVMISNSFESMPFDINSRRIIFYDDRFELINKLRKELGRKIFG